MSDEWERFQQAEAQRSQAASEAHRSSTSNLGTYAFRKNIRPAFMGGMGPPIPQPGQVTEAADPEVVRELRARLRAQQKGLAVPPPEGAELEWGELAPKPRADLQSDVEADLAALRRLGEEEASGVEAEALLAAAVPAAGAIDAPDGHPEVQAPADAPQANLGTQTLAAGQRRCPVCGKVFTVSRKKPNQRTCSKSCAMKERNARRRAEVPQAPEVAGATAEARTTAHHGASAPANFEVWVVLKDGKEAKAGSSMTHLAAQMMADRLNEEGFHNEERDFLPAEFEAVVREKA
jgi:hypothetical protein